MLERTKTLPIDGPRVLTVVCSPEKYAGLINFLENENLDYEEDVPVEEVFPDRSPGTILQGFRYRDCLTQAELSEQTGIPRRHISEMENGKRPIGKQTAEKLAYVFKTDPRIFL